MFPCTLILAVAITSVFAEPTLDTKHIEVDNINKLTHKERLSLFEPTSYLSASKKTAQHNINIFDKFGKFIRLNYHSQYEDHIDIFELKPNQENDIKSVQCVNNATNIINVRFTDKYTALKYSALINTHLENDPSKNKYFVTGSHEWKCYNSKEKRNTPILRTISSATIDINDDNLLVLTTNYAAYTDLFQNLKMSLETNANINKQETAAQTPESRRKLLETCDGNPEGSSWVSDIIESVTNLFSAVASIVSDLEDFVESIQNIYQYATQLHDSLSGVYNEDITASINLWEYNYGGKSLTLEDSVICETCYAYAQLSYSVEIWINNYDLTYFKMVADGDVKVKVDMKASESINDEWSAKTCKYSIPELGFSIAGIHFGFSVYGEFAVGIDVDKPFDYGIWAVASIKRGIEYWPYYDKQDYIEEQSFKHGSYGPTIDFNSKGVTLYGRATLYLVLSLVGDVYIGVQPKVSISLSTYTSSDSCAVYYTPKATIDLFVGANVNLGGWLSIWKKQANIRTWTMSGYNSGCITKSDIQKLETWAHDLYCANANWVQRAAYCRRRLSIDAGVYDPLSFIVNYTSPNTVYHDDYKWGEQNTVWNANLTAITDVETCDVDTIPDFARIMVYPQDNSGDVIYGIYRTMNNISIEDGYPITTNVYCVGRYKFTRNTSVYNTTNDKIARYNVEIVDDDYKCDVNESIIQPIIHKTQLPSEMNAIILDSSLGTILMQDLNDCFMFPLTHNTEMAEVVFTSGDIAGFINESYSWPSKTWFGSLHCDDTEKHELVNISDSLTLYLNTIAWIYGKVNATLIYSENNDYLIGMGDLDLYDLTLNFDFYDEYDEIVFNANGFITALYDGKLLYSGVIPSHSECTGFIFQGYMDMDQFSTEERESVVITNNADSDSTTGITGRDIGLLATGCALTLMLMMTIMCILMKCKGYSLVQNNNEKYIATTYQLMQDESL